ncbi:MAG: response regulator [Chitinophagaceae bacterium]|nr:response regulator [Anaerolineae bacterium]
MNSIPHDLLQGWDIVIVDDEGDSLEVASFILDFYGANVHAGTSGQEALTLAIEVRPRFIISDLSMPGMDGWELLNALKSNLATRDIPVIALTAHAMVGDRDRAIAAGFHNYLTKPLTANTFIDQLIQLLMNIPVLSEHLNI